MNRILLGIKVGSTQLFEDSGEAVHVTIVALEPSAVVEIKTRNSHGYDAVVLASGKRKASRLNNAERGYGRKHKLGPYKSLFEVRLRSDDEIHSVPDIGSIISVTDLDVKAPIDVSAVSKGKGFAGVIKRWNFAGQDRSHGNSLSHRVLGSIGINGAGRVWKGKKMSGHMGAKKVTLKDVTLLRIDKTKNLLFVKGPVPGFDGTVVRVMQTSSSAPKPT